MSGVKRVNFCRKTNRNPDGTWVTTRGVTTRGGHHTGVSQRMNAWSHECMSALSGEAQGSQRAAVICVRRGVAVLCVRRGVAVLCVRRGVAVHCGYTVRGVGRLGTQSPGTKTLAVMALAKSTRKGASSSLSIIPLRNHTYRRGVRWGVKWQGGVRWRG